MTQASINTSKKSGDVVMRRLMFGEVLLLEAPGYTSMSAELVEAADPNLLYKTFRDMSEYVAIFGENGAVEYRVDRYDEDTRTYHCSRVEVRDHEANWIAGPWGVTNLRSALGL
jgi:hypothetical protein